MSTILEALRKAEEERVMESLPQTIVVTPPVSTFPWRRVLPWIIVAILLAVIVMVFFHPAFSSGPAAGAKHGERGDVAVARSPDKSQAGLFSGRGRAGLGAGRGQAGVFDGSAKGPDILLSGVLWDDLEPVAILNGRTLRMGEEIEGARIVKIELDGVQLLYNGKVHELSVR